jgi:hypothetical protein
VEQVASAPAYVPVTEPIATTPVPAFVPVAEPIPASAFVPAAVTAQAPVFASEPAPRAVTMPVPAAVVPTPVPVPFEPASAPLAATSFEPVQVKPVEDEVLDTDEDNDTDSFEGQPSSRLRNFLLFLLVILVLVNVVVFTIFAYVRFFA